MQADLGLGDGSLGQADAGEGVHGALYGVTADPRDRVQSLLRQPRLQSQLLQGGGALLERGVRSVQPFLPHSYRTLKARL